MFRSFFLTVSILLVHGQPKTNCNYFGHWVGSNVLYWAIGRCSAGGTYGIRGNEDVRPVCESNTTLKLYNYPKGSGCAGFSRSINNLPLSMPTYTQEHPLALQTTQTTGRNSSAMVTPAQLNTNRQRFILFLTDATRQTHEQTLPPRRPFLEFLACVRRRKICTVTRFHVFPPFGVMFPTENNSFYCGNGGVYQEAGCSSTRNVPYFYSYNTCNHYPEASGWAVTKGTNWQQMISCTGLRVDGTHCPEEVRKCYSLDVISHINGAPHFLFAKNFSKRLEHAFVP